MIKATLVLACALGVALGGVVPAYPQQTQYLQQQVPQPSLPPQLAQQVRALPPVFRSSPPAVQLAHVQQPFYQQQPAQALQGAPQLFRAATPGVAPSSVAYQRATENLQGLQEESLASHRAAAQAAAQQPRPVARQQQPQLRRLPANQAQAGVPIEETAEDYDSNPAYNFSFDVKDDQFTNYQNRKESREGDQIKGSYSVVDSDGFIRTVTYTADPIEGFKAEVIREPTSIVVKLPTPAPATAAGPQQYAAQPQQQYAPQPQQSSRAGPQAYAPAPQAYAPAPQAYAPAPQQAYAPASTQALRAGPQQVRLAPKQAYAVQPAQYQG